jgi:hypothetical protein
VSSHNRPLRPAVVQAYGADAHGGRKRTPYVTASPALSCRFGREMRFHGFRFHQAPRQGNSVEEAKIFF